MYRHLMGSMAVIGLLLSMPNAHERAIAQKLREPTLDNRFRDAGDRAPEAELPLVNPPQGTATLDSREADDGFAPAYLGVTFRDEDRDAVVQSVHPGSPAEQAGLRPDDVIETLQGLRISSPQDVLDIIAKMRSGDTLDLGISRRMHVSAQAALTSRPATGLRNVGYSQELSAAGNLDAAENPERELLPIPSKVKRDTHATGSPHYRNTAPQHPNGVSPGPRRNDKQVTGQSNGDRRFRDRVLRRR